MTAIIDAHHHLWSLSDVRHAWLAERGVRRFFGDPTPIQRDYLVPDYRADCAGIALLGDVHVQVGVAPGAEIEETAFLAAQRNVHGGPSAAVAFADLRADDLAATLESHAQFDLVRGVRQIVGRRADEDAARNESLLADPRFAAGLKRLAAHDLSFDLQARFDQLEACAALLAPVEGLRVALCHLGSPWDRSPEGFARWRRGINAMARLPGAHAKISGLGMLIGRWRVEDAWPLVEAVIDAFGAERVMIGSNFPVDTLAQPADETWRQLIALCASLSEAERVAIQVETARRFYRLQS